MLVKRQVLQYQIESLRTRTVIIWIFYSITCRLAGVLVIFVDEVLSKINGYRIGVMRTPIME